MPGLSTPASAVSVADRVMGTTAAEGRSYDHDTEGKSRAGF